MLDLIEKEEEKVFGELGIGDHVAALGILEKRTYLITPEQNAGAVRSARTSKKK